LDNIGEFRAVIEAFRKAVDQASFVLKKNPELTFPQLYNRLWLQRNTGRLILYLGNTFMMKEQRLL